MKLFKEFTLGIAIITLGVFATSFTKTKEVATPKFGVGEKVANIVLNNPAGQKVSLDSVSDGKLTLIDFWASWCGPCRRESPYLVAAYNKYKDVKFQNAPLGFDIFSVSFDAPGGLERWKGAIKQDGLIWPNHVSELKGWRSEYGRVYGVGSIPYNVLIDDSGTVLAQNLRGANIENILKQLVAK